MPLYRYQLRLRLARALDLLGGLRRPDHARPGSRLLQPQPFQRRLPAGLWPHAGRVPALDPIALNIAARCHRGCVKVRRRGRDDVAAVFRRTAVPGGDDAAGLLDDRDQRDDVIGLEPALDDEIDMAGASMAKA